MRVSTQARERAPRSFWFDPRFAIGVVLVLLSIGGVYGVVTAADTSVQVYAARAALSPGDRVTSGDLDSLSVRLGDVRGRYVVAGSVPRAGLVVTRVVAAGELLPTAAVGSTASISVASVVVTVSGELAGSVAPGSVVDVWSASPSERTATSGSAVFEPPSVLVAAATVVRLVKSDGLIAGRTGEPVEILVPRSSIARVLEAIANADAISLVALNAPPKD